MNNDTKIIRTVSIDRETLNHAWREKRKLKMLDETLADLIEELCDKKVEKEERFWEAMRIKADATPNEVLRINWITSQIEITEETNY